MREALLVSLTVLALGAGPTLAQDSGRGGPMIEEGGGNAGGAVRRNDANRPAARPNRPPIDIMATPPACEAAYAPAPAATPAPPPGAAVPAAIARMQDLMTKAATINNPDLAYNCAMIAHNQGAIALAEEEVRSGQDLVSKKIAERTKKIRGNEIRRMQRFINRMTHPKKV